MKPDYSIVEASSPEHVETARELFREYEAWLGMSLCFQGFEEELAALPGKYAPENGGRLWLAFVGAEPVGCMAFRRLEEGVGEMKRLYVRDTARGKGIGLALIETLIETAREIGCERIRLDTYPPKMGKAVGLYESHGFRQIPPYYDNPHDGVLYMEKLVGTDG